MNLPELRENYTQAGLDLPDLDPSPYRQFQKWMQQAIDAGLPEPNAMTLSTSSPQGIVTARTVLLKGLDDSGFSFFTNYSSQKASDLDQNPNAALTFLWKELERQVCIHGSVTKTDRQSSEDYFHSRPRGSQIGAWVSENQSAVIPDRAFLEKKEAALIAQFPDQIPLPDFWGGYLLEPTQIEFWQGRPSRLHDRLAYTHNGQTWEISRKSP